MPMREYICPCGNKFEGYQPSSKIEHTTRCCPKCLKEAKLIVISRPAKRNPAHGIQK